MIKNTKKQYYAFGAALTTGLSMVSDMAFAQGAGAIGTPNSFSQLAKNVTTQINEMPGLISALAYMFGLLLAVLGILKIKDHVENPSQTPLKDGAIRLLIGGALFALPFILESMFALVTNGETVATTDSAIVQKIEFNVE